MKNLKHLKHKKPLFAFALVLVAVVASVILKQPKEDMNEDTLWREYKASYGDITASLDGGGALEATGVHHSFDVDLKIEQLLVEVGQQVKTGDVLAKYSVNALKEKITELNESLQKAQRTLEDVKNSKQKAQLENGLNGNEPQQDAQTTYESSKRELENAIHAAEQKIGQLQEKITKLLQDLKNAEASSDGSADSGDLKKLKDELAHLQEELAKLKSKNPVNGSDEQITSLEQQRSDLKTQLTEVENQISDITSNTSSLNDFKQQLAMLQEEIAALPKDDPQLSILQTKAAELKAQIDGYQDEFGKLEELKKQKTDLENQISSFNVQISSLSDAACDAAAIEKKQAQIDKVQQKINALSSKEENITSLQEQIQQAQTDLEAAKLDLETQRIALNALNNNHDKQTGRNKDNQTTQEQINVLNNAALDNAIKNAQDEVEKIRKDLVKANKLLDTPKLTANVDGVVTELNYKEGDDVPGGKSIVTVGNSDEKRVVTQVSQEDIGGVVIGQVVEMQFLASPDETVKGRVLEKSLVPSEGGDGITYKVIIGFDEQQPELLQGMTCSVKFIIKRVEHVLTLSNKAITLKNGKQIVTVLLPDGTQEEREIQTGFSDGRVSEITSGLSDGETVVTAG